MFPLIVLVVGVSAMITAFVLAVRKQNRDRLKMKREYWNMLQTIYKLKIK